jgi:adenylate kinase
MHIVMLGAPGAGKGTQAEILSQEMGLCHVASGDLFRGALEEGTTIGLLARGYMERGELVPDDVTIGMILERLSEADCAAGCVFDGFPRNLEQARALDQALGEQAKTIDRAIYIEVPPEQLVKRLSGRWLCRSCQRPYHLQSSPPEVPGKCDKCGGELFQRCDDREETIRERLNVFFAQTLSILDYYDSQHKLIKVNGDPGIRGVATEIASALKVTIE